MAVYSMTGYASAQFTEPATDSQPISGAGFEPQLSTEIRSVNSRFLDLVFRLPDDFRGLEPALRELLGSKLKRGKVEVRINMQERAAAGLPAPSTVMLQHLTTLQTLVQAQSPQAAPLSVMELLNLNAKAASFNPTAALSEKLLTSVGHTLEAFLQARKREGEKLTHMLRERTTALRALAHQLVPMVPQWVEQQRVRFLERWHEALSSVSPAASSPAAQERAWAESTAFAIRIDVAEEISRLLAHLDEIERLLTVGGEIGKRLDFLTQELHREANTLGSKSAALELTRVSLDMKVLIEQIREQVQNIE